MLSLGFLTSHCRWRGRTFRTTHDAVSSASHRSITKLISRPVGLLSLAATAFNLPRIYSASSQSDQGKLVDEFAHDRPHVRRRHSRPGNKCLPADALQFIEKAEAARHRGQHRRTHRLKHRRRHKRPSRHPKFSAERHKHKRRSPQSRRSRIGRRKRMRHSPEEAAWLLSLTRKADRSPTRASDPVSTLVVPAISSETPSHVEARPREGITSQAPLDKVDRGPRSQESRMKNCAYQVYCGPQGCFLEAIVQLLRLTPSVQRRLESTYRGLLHQELLNTLASMEGDSRVDCSEKMFVEANLDCNRQHDDVDAFQSLMMLLDQELSEEKEKLIEPICLRWRDDGARERCGSPPLLIRPSPESHSSASWRKSVEAAIQDRVRDYGGARLAPYDLELPEILTLELPAEAAYPADLASVPKTLTLRSNDQKHYVYQLTGHSAYAGNASNGHYCVVDAGGRVYGALESPSRCITHLIFHQLVGQAPGG